MSGMVEHLRTFNYEGQQPGPHLLITAGVHGDEFESIAAVQRLIRMFDKNDSRIDGFRGQVTLVPVVNESAFLRGHRCGNDGLDLARVCPGRKDGNVTEQAAYRLSKLIRQADYYIDLHTGGTEFSVLPLAGYTLHSDSDVLRQQRAMATAFDLPFVWGTSADLEGRSLSVARDAGIPAIYCEYLGSATCDPKGIESYVNGCLNVMNILNMLERDSPIGCAQQVIEDDTPDSGHMQVCNRSPVTGLFEPRRKLGDHVRAGQTLGVVRDLNSNTEHPVPADRDGIVVVLRTFPRVCQGDSVGVVVEADPVDR